MSGVYSRLNFSFDTSKFGDAVYLTENASAFLNVAPLAISTWAQSDLANGTPVMTNYFQNPLANVCSNLTSNTSTIYSTIQNIINTTGFTTAGAAANTCAAAASTLILEIAQFKSHTDNVSGVHTMTSNNDIIPSLQTATTVGNYLLRILNTTDAVSNTVPLLGNMTALFIGDDLASNCTTISGYNSTINMATTSTVLNTITVDLNTVYNYIFSTRTNDWNFYINSSQIVSDYISLNKLENMGGTQKYLANNLIGTDRLKENIANS